MTKIVEETSYWDLCFGWLNFFRSKYIIIIFAIMCIPACATVLAVIIEYSTTGEVDPSNLPLLDSHTHIYGPFLFMLFGFSLAYICLAPVISKKARARMAEKHSDFDKALLSLLSMGLMGLVFLCIGVATLLKEIF